VSSSRITKTRRSLFRSYRSTPSAQSCRSPLPVPVYPTLLQPVAQLFRSDGYLPFKGGSSHPDQQGRTRFASSDRFYGLSRMMDGSRRHRQVCCRLASCIPRHRLGCRRMMKIDPESWPTLSRLLDQWLDLPEEVPRRVAGEPRSGTRGHSAGASEVSWKRRFSAPTRYGGARRLKIGNSPGH
jgi:hypothetical protein